MVLEVGELPYELCELDVLAGEHRLPAYRAINPAGYVPALRTPEGIVLHETPAIMLYLAERHELTQLAPVAGDPLRGEFLSGLFFLSNDIQPEVKRFYFPARYSPEPEHAGEAHRQAKAVLLDRYAVIERRLSDGRPCYLGERFSLVDLTLAFWATSFHPQGELYGDCPWLKDYCDRVIAENRCAHHIVSHQESSFRYWCDYLR